MYVTVGRIQLLQSRLNYARCHSTEMMMEFVVAIPGSISFVGADEVTDAVRVVRVDGKLPADPGYPLR